MFFSSTLSPAHTFLILILQTASYTHACRLTLISGGSGVLRSICVLHTKLKRPVKTSTPDNATAKLTRLCFVPECTIFDSELVPCFVQNNILNNIF